MKQDKKTRILIVGLPKSGTTILTYRVAAAYKKAKVFFEPGKQHSLNKPEIHEDIFLHPRNTAITKSLFIPIEQVNIPAIEKFYSKKIWIYRDPRDWIISRYMYKWKHLNDMKVNHFCNKLRNKENNPSDVNFHPLMTPNFINSSVYNYNKLIEVLGELSDDWCIIKYEDFVDGRIEKLNSYLGIQIDPTVEVDKKFSRVARSKSYNNWKVWFNENDVDFFTPKFNRILKQLNYTPIDWDIDNPVQIDSNLGSDYVMRLHESKMKM